MAPTVKQDAIEGWRDLPDGSREVRCACGRVDRVTAENAGEKYNAWLDHAASECAAQRQAQS